MNNKMGFTVMEVLVVSVVLLFVLTAVYCTYVMMSQYVGDTTTQAALQAEARIAVERIARDVRLATNVTCDASGGGVTLTFDPTRMGQGGSQWQSRYRLVGNQIIFQPDVNLGGQTVIIDNVDLNIVGGERLFTHDPTMNLLRIFIRVRGASISLSEQKASFSTIVRLRNVY